MERNAGRAQRHEIRHDSFTSLLTRSRQTRLKLATQCLFAERSPPAAARAGNLTELNVAEQSVLLFFPTEICEIGLCARSLYPDLAGRSGNS